MTDPSGEPAAGEDTPLSRGEARRQADNSSAFHDHVRAARSEFEQQFDRARADFEQVQDRINERTGRNLLMAILIGLAVGAVVLASLLFVKWLFLIFALLVCLLGVFEFARALEAAGRRIDVVPQLVAAAIIMLSGLFLGHWTHWVITFACVAAVIVWRMLAQMAARHGRPSARASATRSRRRRRRR